MSSKPGGRGQPAGRLKCFGEQSCSRLHQESSSSSSARLHANFNHCHARIHSSTPHLGCRKLAARSCLLGVGQDCHHQFLVRGSRHPITFHQRHCQAERDNQRSLHECDQSPRKWSSSRGSSVFPKVFRTCGSNTVEKRCRRFWFLTSFSRALRAIAGGQLFAERTPRRHSGANSLFASSTRVAGRAPAQQSSGIIGGLVHHREACAVVPESRIFKDGFDWKVLNGAMAVSKAKKAADGSIWETQRLISVLCQRVPGGLRGDAKLLLCPSEPSVPFLGSDGAQCISDESIGPCTMSSTILTVAASSSGPVLRELLQEARLWRLPRHTLVYLTRMLGNSSHVTDKIVLSRVASHCNVRVRVYLKCLSPRTQDLVRWETVQDSFLKPCPVSSCDRTRFCSCCVPTQTLS